MVTPANPREAKSLSVELNSLCFVLRLFVRWLDWGDLINLLFKRLFEKIKFLSAGSKTGVDRISVGAVEDLC